MNRELRRLMEPLARRIRLAAARAVVSLIDDGTKMQLAQVKLLAEEVRDRVERFQQYGFTSVPHPGAEGVYLSLNGSREHGVLIVVDDRRYRLVGLEAGEAALYDDQGQKVHLTRNGIVVDGGGKLITFTNAPKARFEMPIEATGDIKDRCDDAAGRTMSGMRGTYDNHDHPGDSGGTTGHPNQAM